MKPCKVIAEIGCAHIGSLDRAKELCKLAKLAGADYVKSQKRNPDESTPDDIKNKPHPNQIFAYGTTYLEHRKALELPIEAHHELFRYCQNELGIGYTVSVWDMTSAKQAVEMNPYFIKIGSPSNQNWDMMRFLFKEYTGGVHISLGMITPAERDVIFRFIADEKVDFSRIVVYNCTSRYPCPFEDIYLKEIENLVRSVPLGMEVGFSNHGLGIALDPVAYTLGATWIERHFVDDRTLRHNDAAASLEPDGLRRVCRDLKAVSKALCYRPEQLSEEEMAQRSKLKR